MVKAQTIEFRQLRYFLTAAEFGSFRRASNALNTQESAISRRIRDLEKELGASLFQRYHGGVRLTSAGQRFLVHARKILQQIDDGVKDVAAIGAATYGQLKVGIISSLASGFLFELLQAFDRRHRGVTVEMIDSSQMEHIAAIRQLRLDIAFLNSDHVVPGCEIDHLWSEQVFAALPCDHMLSRQDVLQWNDLAGLDFIVSARADGLQINNFLVDRFKAFGITRMFASII